MNSQFKNPLQGKDQPAAQNEAWLTGGAQPAVPGNQSQGSFSPTGQIPPQAGSGLFPPPWQSDIRPSQTRETPHPAGLTEQSTVKQPSFPGPNASGGPNMLAPTPGYIQGRHGRYGPGPGGQFPPSGPNNGPMNMPQGPGGSRTFAPGQHSGPPMGPGRSMGPMPGAPNFNSFNATNPGSAFSGPGGSMLASPPVPGTFNPSRGPMGPAGPMGPNRRISDGPTPPGKGPGSTHKKKRRVPIWARIVIGVLTFLLLLAGGGFAYYQIYFAPAISHIVGQKVALAPGEEDPNANRTGDLLSGPRINILLLGSDTDQKFQGQYIAQTDIVVTIDPGSKTVGMLSIPRDFYISVPGYGMHKLDEAYGLGGVDLSRRTIEQDFGIPINYYAWVGLDGFIKVIDEVGGVDVNVLHPIVDGNYPDDVGAHANDPYAFKRLYLPAGPQHLDGPSALEYVRSRHADLVGDFGRSARQQQVLGALKTRLTNPSIFGKLSAIANDLNGFVKTDMDLPDVLKLMNFARSIDPNNINRLILGPPYSSSVQLPSGESAVAPNCARIIPAIAQMLQLGNKAVCNVGTIDTSQPSPLTSPTTGDNNQPPPLPDPSIDNSIQGLDNMVSNPTTGLNDLFGVHSLLDLLFLGVFETPNAFQA